MAFYFLIGTGIGAGLVWLLYFSARREIVRIEEEKQLLQQEKHTVIEFMHNLVEAIGEGVAREELYQRIVHAGILSTGALSACLFERTPDDTLKGIATEGLFPPQKVFDPNNNLEGETRTQFIENVLKSETFNMGEGIIGSVAQSRQAVLIKNATKDPRIVQHQDSSLTTHSIIVAPILFRKKVLGVLAVANPTDSMPFNENDFSLVESLAEQAGMAIHNSNLMALLIEKNKLDFELTLASNIQGMLLPSQFPDNSSLDIGAFYEPAQKVGGDLYDVFEIDEHRVGVAIADVSGKGVPASLLMAICQTNLRHFAKKFDSPAEVLKAMNTEMNSDIRQDMFITIIYAIVDTRIGDITVARAGHEKPILLTPSTNDPSSYQAEKIVSEGMALGMVPPELFNSVITETTIPFHKNDIFVLYTDGITEALDDSSMEFGFNRLTTSLHKAHETNASKMCEFVIEDVKNFTSSLEDNDDLTLVTIKHT